MKVRKKRITRGWSHRERHQQNISFDCNDILMEGFVFSELNAQTFSAEFHFPHVLLCLADSNLLPMKLIGTSGPQFETVPKRVEHLNRSPVPLTSWIAQAALRELYTVGDSAPRGEVGHPEVVLRALPLSRLFRESHLLLDSNSRVSQSYPRTIVSQ